MAVSYFCYWIWSEGLFALIINNLLYLVHVLHVAPVFGVIRGLQELIAYYEEVEEEVGPKAFLCNLFRKLEKERSHRPSSWRPSLNLATSGVLVIIT